MKKLRKLPKMQASRPKRLRKMDVLTTRRTRRGPILVELKPDLEKQAWPKGKPYIDPRTGPQIGTLPERRVLWWLLYKADLKPTDFEFQSDWRQAGTLFQVALADFVIYNMAGGVLVWEVMGTHWHALPWHKARDYLKRLRVMASRHNGLPVLFYIELWERDLNLSDSRRNHVCERAMQGVEIGG